MNCSVSDCLGTHYGLGYCNVHYYRFKRNGHTDLIRTGDPCKVDGCERKHFGLGWCKKHYRAFKAHGDPLGKATPKRQDAQERFWSKVDKSGDCWLWTAGKTPHGYGHFWFDGGTVNAHRFAYESLRGPIPDGLPLDHLCRTPACVNPAHLEPVTAQVNTLRGISVAATNAAKSHCIHGHEFTEANTYLYQGRRICRACAKARSKASNSA